MQKAKLIFRNPKVLKSLSEATTALLLPEIQMHLFKDDGVWVSNLDSSKAAHVAIHIPVSEMESYEISEEMDVTLDKDAFDRIAKRLARRPDEKAVLSVEDSGALISNIGPSIRTYEVNRLSPTLEFKKVNNLGKSFVSVDAEEFFEQIKDLEGLSSSVSLIVSNGNFFINGNSHEVKTSIQTTLEEKSFVLEHNGENAESNYNFSYLNSIAKFINGEKFEKVGIYFGTDKPITLIMNSGDIEFRFLVAPVIEKR